MTVKRKTPLLDEIWSKKMAKAKEIVRSSHDLSRRPKELVLSPRSYYCLCEEVSAEEQKGNLIGRWEMGSLRSVFGLLINVHEYKQSDIDVWIN